MTAAMEWSKANGEHIHAWWKLLDDDARFWASSLGSAIARSLEERGRPLERRTDLDES